MPRSAAHLPLLLFVGTAAVADDGDAFPRGEVLFALDVRPVLANKCFACHGDDRDGELGGELDLRTREGLLAGGETGDASVVPGDSKHSYLYELLLWEGGYGMPPKEADKLTERQAWAVRDWIDAGAPWPDDDRVAAIVAARDTGVTVPTSGGLSADWTDRRYDPADLWAYQPLADPPVPAGFADAATAADAFVNERLAAAGLEPAGRADRRTLVRRVTYDLTGLPPTPGEIAAFLADDRDDRTAFAAVVDRLLAGPHFGEKFATNWLDVVRYADSAGFANDFERPNAWRYRDWVVRAFNDDLAYDRFLTLQIAGDELVDAGKIDDPRNAADALIAPGFLRMGPWEHTGMSVAKETRQQFLDDVTDTVGQAFLAHPLQCAKCHDHKFDPVPTRDYYAIQAVFATTQFADRDVPFTDRENTDGFGERRYLEQRIDRYAAEKARIDRKARAAEEAWYADRGLGWASRAKKQAAGVPEDEIAPPKVGLETFEIGMERITRKGLNRHRWELDRYEPIALSVYSGAERGGKPVYDRLTLPDDSAAGRFAESAILTGGDPFSPGQPVEPGVLSAPLFAVDPAAADPVPADPVGRRLAFARWLADPSHPLTPRVTANRVWAWLFGRGLAANPNNFGKGGAKPTHPDLLDHLASGFVRDGYSVKRLVRRLVLSDAYARSSRHPAPEAVAEADPDGALLAAFRPRRLTAEEIRDSRLAVSGELNPAVGGIPVRPAINREAALQPRQIMGTFAPAWQPNPRPEQRNRRTLYTLKLRGLRAPFLEVFNAPGPDTPCERREVSTVAPQAFTLFNSEQSHTRALATAGRLLGEADSDADAVDRLYRLALGRPPTAEEAALCVSHWHRMTTRHASLHFGPTRPPAEVTRDAVEENTGERFTFTEVLEQAADYLPDPQPADADARTRGLAEVCLVVFNANEFLYVE